MTYFLAAGLFFILLAFCLILFAGGLSEIDTKTDLILYIVVAGLISAIDTLLIFWKLI